MTKILGPLPCSGCGRPVWWDRIGTEVRLMDGKRSHLCDDKPVPIRPPQITRSAA